MRTATLTPGLSSGPIAIKQRWYDCLPQWCIGSHNQYVTHNPVPFFLSDEQSVIVGFRSETLKQGSDLRDLTRRLKRSRKLRIEIERIPVHLR